MTERDIETLQIFAGFLHMAQLRPQGRWDKFFCSFFFNRRSSATQRNVNTMRQLGGLPSFCTVPAGTDALQSKKFLLSVYPCKTWKRRVQRYSFCPKKRYWGVLRPAFMSLFSYAGQLNPAIDGTASSLSLQRPITPISSVLDDKLYFSRHDGKGL